MGIVKHFRSLGDEDEVPVRNLYALENTQGYNDYNNGYSLSQNPYDTESQVAQNIAWQVGWLRAKRDLNMFGV